MTIEAKVLAYSISPEQVAPPLISMQLRYPRFIHSELMTHRVFSRNASSSRAIPVERLIQDIIDDPVYPSFWGKNQSGMQAVEECNELVEIPHFYPVPHYELGIDWDSAFMNRMEAWDEAREQAIKFARAFAKAGYHKQIVNRLLEPFSHINVVVSSTDWNNFFGLRCHKDAQPEIRILAEKIWEAQQTATPQKLKFNKWHLPYITDEMRYHFSTEELIKVSAARCARVSYLTHDGRVSDVSADIALYEKLALSQPLHASPCEHQATPDRYWSAPKNDGQWHDPELHGNFTGWIQHRKTLDNEYITNFVKE